jgi:hypothetical protein
VKKRKPKEVKEEKEKAVKPKRTRAKAEPKAAEEKLEMPVLTEEDFDIYLNERLGLQVAMRNYRWPSNVESVAESVRKDLRRLAAVYLKKVEAVEGPRPEFFCNLLSEIKTRVTNEAVRVVLQKL